MFSNAWSKKGTQNKTKIGLGTGAYSIAPQIDKVGFLSSKNIKLYHVELVF